MTLQTRKKKLYKTLSIVLIGTAVEYYDISLFAFIAPLLAEAFLPEIARTEGTILIYLTYFIGVLARPFGSHFFGRMGDKGGRTTPLIITMTGMATISVMIALIPSPTVIGVGALVLFTLLRTMQQFFVSGHFNGGAIYCIEQSEGIWRPGFVSGVYNAATVAGIVFAAFIAMVIASLGAQYWRFGYLIGAIIALISLLFRRFLSSSIPYITPATQSTPKVTWRGRLAISLISLYFGMLYALSAKVMNVVISNISPYGLSTVLQVNLAVTILYFFFLIVAGALADKIGAKRQMMIAILVSPFVLFIATSFDFTTIAQIFAAKCMIIGLVALFFGPAHSYYVQEIPYFRRYHTISLFHTFGKMLSSLSPALFLMLWEWDLSFKVVNAIIVIIGVVTLLTMHKCNSVLKKIEK